MSVNPDFRYGAMRRYCAARGTKSGPLIKQALCVGLVLIGQAACLLAQSDFREYPPQAYYLGKNLLHEGEFGDALRTFRSASRAGIRSTEGRWVDSVCYATMLGECFYQMGQIRQAVDQYTVALQHFVAYRNWMIRVDFPPALEPSRRALRPATWGPGTRGPVIGHFHDRYAILTGRLDNANVLLQSGGVVALPEYLMVNAPEIARCTALSIRRRRELMGSVGKYDPLTRQVLAALRTRPARQNHWSQAFIDVQLGMAAAAAGDVQQAISDLGNGTLALGTFDHPLTGMALFELGKLAFEHEQYARAAKFFHEASLSAAVFEDYALVEESLRWGAKTHLVAGQATPYAPLAPAIAWARRESRLTEASLLVAASENATALGDIAAAVSFGDQARRRMARTEMLAGDVGARLSYVSALANYQAGKLKVGDVHLGKLMQYQKVASRRLFEIELVDRVYAAGEWNDITDRAAEELYKHVLREPTGRDWVTEPVETQTVLLAPLVMPMQNWLSVTLKRRDADAALEITDRIRRQRFFSTLPMGGRLLALRWVLGAPESALGERAVLQRHALLTRFPKFQQLTQRAEAVHEQLAEMPLAPTEAAVHTAQQRWLQELATISSEQELMLRAMALQRVPAQMTFPPQLDFKAIQPKLADGQYVLSFLTTGRGVLAFFFGNDTYGDPWFLGATKPLEQDIVKLLQGMGQLDRNQPIDAESLASTAWQEPAARIAAQLLKKPLPPGLEELIVVPDGPLWYVPFEALPLTEEGGAPLISSARVRYAPTVALAFPDSRRSSPVGRTLVVAGKLFPRDELSVAESAATELSALLPNVTAFAELPPVPSGLLASLCERVIVYDDIDDKVPNPYAMSPLQIDRNKSGNSLAQWMQLPWNGPQQVVLPGYHSPAEVGLRNGGTGSDMFLTVCGLMSAGARTILISRWRPGGQSSYDLVREFVQELPYVSAADAWQRSVQLAMESTLIVEREPRIRFSSLESSLPSNHPFFWAGNLLIDTGVQPALDEDFVAEVDAE